MLFIAKAKPNLKGSAVTAVPRSRSDVGLYVLLPEVGPTAAPAGTDREGPGTPSARQPCRGGGMTGGNALTPTLIRSRTFHRIRGPQSTRRHTRGRTAATVRAERFTRGCARCARSGALLRVERNARSGAKSAERSRCARAVQCARSGARCMVHGARCTER